MVRFALKCYFSSKYRIGRNGCIATNIALRPPSYTTPLYKHTCYFLGSFAGYPSFSTSPICQHYLSTIPYITIRQAGEDQGFYRFVDLDSGINDIDWNMKLGEYIRSYIRRPEIPSAQPYQMKDINLLLGFTSFYIRYVFFNLLLANF